MSKSVAFQKLVENRLFFSGQSLRNRWSIGLADLRGDVFSDPRLVELKAKWAFREMMTPNVVETKDGFIMAFAGRRTKLENHIIFIARSGSLDGPWEVEDQPYTPAKYWEGRNIDLGPGSILGDDSALFFYSNAFPRFDQIVASFLKKPHFPTKSILNRYTKRRIGILKVSLKPHTIQPSGTLVPLKCTPGTPFESVFCPGYVTFGGRHVLFVACSNYSSGYPYEQLIGVVESDSFPTEWETEKEIRPIITSKDLPPPFSRNSAFDTPDPIPIGNDVLRLYFSAMSRDEGRWSIMECDIGQIKS